MKLLTKHIALAVTGWYLLMPVEYPNGRILYKAPLKEWDQIAAFDSASDCEVVSYRLTHEDPSPEEEERIERSLRSQGQPVLSLEQRHRRDAYAVCVSSDDPRLAR